MNIFTKRRSKSQISKSTNAKKNEDGQYRSLRVRRRSSLAAANSFLSRKERSEETDRQERNPRRRRSSVATATSLKLNKEKPKGISRQYSISDSNSIVSKVDKLEETDIPKSISFLAKAKKRFEHFRRNSQTPSGTLIKTVDEGQDKKSRATRRSSVTAAISLAQKTENFDESAMKQSVTSSRSGSIVKKAKKRFELSRSKSQSSPGIKEKRAEEGEEGNPRSRRRSSVAAVTSLLSKTHRLEETDRKRDKKALGQ